MNTLELIKSHFQAYNDHDIQAYMATFSEDVEIYNGTLCVMKGKKDVEFFYTNKRFNNPILRAELINRIVLDNFVIDHEKIFGMQETEVQAILCYEVDSLLIKKVTILKVSV